MVYGEQAMRHLKAIGTVVYLELSCEAVSYPHLVQASGDSPVKGADGLSWYSTDRLVLEIKSLLPATAVSVSGKEKDLVPETGNTEPLGVVPMRIETFTSVMKAEVTDNAGRIQDVRAEWIYGNIPVSYTHLDVYKRQVHNCPRDHRAIGCRERSYH